MKAQRPCRISFRIKIIHNLSTHVCIHVCRHDCYNTLLHLSDQNNISRLLLYMTNTSPLHTSINLFSICYK